MALAALALPTLAKLATSAVRTVAGAVGGLAGGGPTAADTADAKIADTWKSKAKATADDFERMFLEQNLDRLFASSGTEGPLGDNGTGGDVYRSMLVKEYAKAVGKTGGIGISDQVYSQLLKLQEGASHGAGL